jgi:hypothetical protein
MLKQLKLFRVSITEDVFYGVLSGCHVLESLDLERIGDVGCLCISSPTLRSVGLGACFSSQGEVVVEDAPHLERLLLHCPGNGGDTVRVIKAPKLKILGHLSPRISEIQIADVLFKVAAETCFCFLHGALLHTLYIYMSILFFRV